MNFIDMRTVVLGQACITLISALMAGLLFRHNRLRYKGIGLWMGAFLLQSAGIVLVLMRGQIPDVFSVVAANFLSVSGFLLLYSGFCLFWGRPFSNRLNLAFFAVFAGIHAYFTFADPSLPFRNLNINFWIAVFFARCGWAVYSGAPEKLRPAARFPALAAAGFALVALARIGVVLSGNTCTEFFQSCPMDTFLFFLFQLLTTLFTLGLFLLVNRRLLADTTADFEGRVEAQKALGGALKIARLGTWTWCVKSGRMNLSEEMRRIFGLPEDVFSIGIGEVSGRLIHPEDVPYFEACNAALLGGGEAVPLEHRVVLPDGGVRWVHTEISEVMPNEAGAPELIKGYSQDITARKLAEEKLRESGTRLELALASAGMGLWQWDIKTDKRYFDERVCELLGLSYKTFAGGADEFFSVVHPDDLQGLELDMRRTVETDALYHPEYRAIMPDGSVRHLAARGRLRRDEKGAPWLIDGLLWDVTERKAAEAAMQATQKLESLGTLAGGIAHDFNNLLTGITGNLSLIGGKITGDGEVPELVKEAEAACQAAKGLARQLLTFASGGKPLKKPLHLGKLVRESVEFSLRGSGVRAEFSGGEGVCALADRDQIFQAVQNLTMNAAQAMGGGGVIRVETSAVDLRGGEVPPLQAGRYCAVTVRDSGPGMEPIVLARLFEPYFSTKGSGRGLGLAVCRSITLKHGGQITVSTAAGRGSSFTLYLPLTEERPETAGRPAGAAATAATGGRVLIMDDEEVVYKALKRMLGALGYDSEVVTDGAAVAGAWNSAKEAGRPFCLAIMDLTISGGMGGAEAVLRLKEADPSARAVVTSGYSEDPVMASCEAYGFNGMLPKPFQLEDLEKLLREHAC